MQKKIAFAIALALSTSAFAEDLTPTFGVTQYGGSGVGTDPIQFSYRTGEVTGTTQLDPNTSYDGFNLSFDYTTYWQLSGMQSAPDTLNYWFGGYSNNGYTLFDSKSWTLPNGGISGTYNYMYSGDTSGLTSLELKFSGMDGGYWAGMYGPKVTNVSLTSATTAAPVAASPEPEPTNTADGYCSPTDANDPDCSTSYTTASTSDTSSDPLANIVPDSVLSSISDSTTTEDTSGVSNDITNVSTGTEATETVAQTTGQDTGIDDGQDTGTEVSNTGEPEQTNGGSTQTVAETTGEPEPEAVAEVKEEVAEEASGDTTEEASGDTVASPTGVPNIAGAPSVSDIVGNSMDFRSSSEKRASSFLNSVGVNTGAWTGQESNTYGVSFQNGVAGGGVGNQSFGMPSDPTDVAFDAGAPVSGIPSIIDSPIMDVSNQSSMNDGSVVLAQNTYNNSQDFSRVFDVKAKEAVPTTVIPGNNSLGQDGMAESLSVSDLGGIDINTFKQNNMPDNSNWYSDQNRLQQNSIYENQDFYESKEIYNNTGWYK